MLLENDLIAQKKQENDIKRVRDTNEKNERKQAREEKRRMTRYLFPLP